MATVNLGRIKPVFRGAYSGSTAYVVDDIVTHGNETFICIQAHGAGTQATSQTAYWTKLAAKGTDGTDVGTTITTQGDILYRDGSGLQRLPKGTAAQVLKMNGAANAPEWGNLSSDWVKLAKTDVTAVAAVDFQDVFTTDYEVYKVYVNGVAPNSNQNLYIRFFTSGTTEDSGSNYNFISDGTYRQDSNNNRDQFLDAATGQSVYNLGVWGGVGDGTSWSGVNNFELTFYDPKRNHRDSSSKGGAMQNFCTYNYHNTYQIVAQGFYWHNTTGGSGFSGFRVFWNNNANFKAMGTIAVYGLKP